MQKFNIVWVAMLLITMTGCATIPQPTPDDAIVERGPTSSPVINYTDFSDSVRCMDRLFLIHGVEPIYITSAGIPDMSGKGVVGNGARHMLMSAISRMAAQSKAVVFVDLPASPMAYPDSSGMQQPHLETIYQYLTNILQKTLENQPHRRGFVYPDYYIVGATSQVEDKIVSGTVSGAAAFAKGDGGAGREGSVSVISLDMNIADATNFQLLNGLTSTNSIAVIRETKSYDLGIGGILRKAGVDFAIQLDKRQGTQQALRTLIELSAIELIGKLAQVPYWQCLQIDQTNPEMQAQARSWFGAMKPTEQIAFVQKTLRSKGFYNGSISGVLDGATKDAISRYQANEGLIPSGQVNFDLYRVLMGGQFSTKPPKVEDTLPTTQASTQPVKIQLNTLKPIYRVNDAFTFRVGVSGDAYVHCYYQGGDNNIIKVFPNQMQPDPYVRANQQISVPAQNATFEIILEHPQTQENVMCLATDRDISLKLPDALKVTDIQPVKLASMREVRAAYSNVAGQNLATENLVIDVQ